MSMSSEQGNPIGKPGTRAQNPIVTQPNDISFANRPYA
jgi:hypothetical protein